MYVLPCCVSTARKPATVTDDCKERSWHKGSLGMFARRAGMSSLFISIARMSFGHARKASMYPSLLCFNSEDVQKWVPTAAGKACSQGEQVFISTARMSFGHARKASMYPRCCVSTAKMSRNGYTDSCREGMHVRKASRYVLAILFQQRGRLDMLERPACILAVVSAAKMSRNGYRQLPGRHVRKASRYVLAIYFNSGMSFGHARKVSMYPCCCVSTAKMSSDGCKEFRRAGEIEVFGHVRKASRYALAILHFTTAYSLFGHARKAGMYPRCCVSTAKMSRNGTNGCEELSFTPAGEIEVFGHVGNGEQVCPCYIAFQEGRCPEMAPTAARNSALRRQERSRCLGMLAMASRYVLAILHFNSEDVHCLHMLERPACILAVVFQQRGCPEMAPTTARNVPCARVWYTACQGQHFCFRNILHINSEDGTHGCKERSLRTEKGARACSPSGKRAIYQNHVHFLEACSVESVLPPS